MTLDETHRVFFEDLSRELDFWVNRTAEVATQPTSELTGWRDYEAPFDRLQQVLQSPQDKAALRAVLLAGMSGLLHSVMATFDGATQLADEFTVTLITSSGEELGPGLHELLIEHLYETGRLPYREDPSDGAS